MLMSYQSHKDVVKVTLPANIRISLIIEKKQKRNKRTTYSMDLLEILKTLVPVELVDYTVFHRGECVQA